MRNSYLPLLGTAIFDPSIMNSLIRMDEFDPTQVNAQDWIDAVPEQFKKRAQECMLEAFGSIHGYLATESTKQVLISSFQRKLQHALASRMLTDEAWL
jgi:hypothetical protein